MQENDNSEEIATIGEYKDYAYRIYGNDGDILHFHILKDNIANKKGKTECFTYNGKVCKLNIEEIKPLIIFSNSKHFNKYSEIKWRYVVN